MEGGILRRIGLGLGMGVAALALAAGVAWSAGVFKDAHDAPPPGWSGPTFTLSQDYPAKLPGPGPRPWKQVDPRTAPLAYLDAVLQYALKGNVTVDFQGHLNKTRKWYHAPWMHAGASGREFIHGLTKERTSPPGELAPTQTSAVENWAVSMYNPRGGYVLGRVWKDPDLPDPKLARFADGTVAFKLIFTRATVAQVPFLKNSLEWEADVNRATGAGPRPKLRLLQVDLAVRDSRVDSTTGWVFGTFIYNGNAPGASVWQRLVPVGLMWGNDPDKIGTNAKLEQTFINPAATALVQHLGFEKRLNGPVDNPRSSCLSCHSTAQVPLNLSTQGTAFTPSNTAASIARYFRNIKATEPFTPGQVSLGYSLQLQAGIIRRVQAGPLASPTPGSGPALRRPGPLRVPPAHR